MAQVPVPRYKELVPEEILPKMINAGHMEGTKCLLQWIWSNVLKSAKWDKNIRQLASSYDTSTNSTPLF